MMRNELTDRVGVLEDWQWEMAHKVYQEHPKIKDVGGKDQIAEIIKQGFGFYAPIQEMYKDISGGVIIKYTDEDLYSTWNVAHTGYCINQKNKPASEVAQAVEKRYYHDYPALAEHVEYFSTDSTEIRYGDMPDIWPDGRIAVFYVKGGSEGYYVHVEVLREKHICMMLIKTLLEGEGGISWAERTANAISRIMNVR